MKKSFFKFTVPAGILALCLLSSCSPLCANNPAPERVSLTGWISCTTCFEPNACKAQTRWSCTEFRVSQGASYVLVVGVKHYVLSGFEKELAKAASETSVTITGDLSGNQLAVVSIESAPKKRQE
jgi:hypothetical protein